MRQIVNMSEPVETELLIIGAGPAGISLACFLASYGLSNPFSVLKRSGQDPLTDTLRNTVGLKGIMISNAHSTADTPRAHLLNAPAGGNSRLLIIFVSPCPHMFGFLFL